MNSAKVLQSYEYDFPQELIAQKPARPRDRARLLVYRRESREVAFDTFRNIAAHLPKNAVLVFNKTKVVPARLELTKQTGGKVHALYVSHDTRYVTVMADRKLTIGSKLFLTPRTYFTVADQREQFFSLAPSFPIRTIFTILEKFGRTPIPPYIKHSPLSEPELRKEYQTLFARERGSVAAPTASLHFTNALLQKLKQAGHDIHFLTLHVNLGTFAPLTDTQLKTGRLHREAYSIDEKTIQALNQAKKYSRPIIAVGTTVVRTLESAAQKNRLKKRTGTTDLFIRPGYRFKFVDGIITNFHVPRSSLMMLVAAFVGHEKLLKLYRTAIRRRFRLFSFGDGMLII